ncbi:MAG: endonuclease/exonuclease/phosphatase family protein [Pseudomonadota bacterium]
MGSRSLLSHRPARRFSGAGAGGADDARLRLVTWNLGYAGLGAEADFRAEGGRRLLPPSRRAVGRAIAQQTAFLAAEPFDVALLQEAARRGPMTWWRDHLGALDAALPEAERWFLPDIATSAPPAPLGLAHGAATYARAAPGAAPLEARAHPLPSDAKPLVARVRRRFGALEIRAPRPGAARGAARAWRVFNLHLSAFDPEARLRARQLERLLVIAEAAYAEGDAVILGGDFNLALADTAFPHDPASARACLAWMRPFPQERLKPGWRLIADARIPSVRTVDQPYRPGVNMCAVIDGFIIAPNVAVERCEGVDLGFGPSDHQPVRATFRAQRGGV